MPGKFGVPTAWGSTCIPVDGTCSLLGAASLPLSRSACAEVGPPPRVCARRVVWRRAALRCALTGAFTVPVDLFLMSVSLAVGFGVGIFTVLALPCAVAAAAAYEPTAIWKPLGMQKRVLVTAVTTFLLWGLIAPLVVCESAISPFDGHCGPGSPGGEAFAVSAPCYIAFACALLFAGSPGGVYAAPTSTQFAVVTIPLLLLEGLVLVFPWACGRFAYKTRWGECDQGIPAAGAVNRAGSARQSPGGVQYLEDPLLARGAAGSAKAPLLGGDTCSCPEEATASPPTAGVVPKAVSGPQRKLVASAGGALPASSVAVQPPAPAPTPAVAASAPSPVKSARNAVAAAEATTERECIVCLTRPKNTAFQCGHQTCDVCAATLSACPVCRAAITLRLRLY